MLGMPNFFFRSSDFVAPFIGRFPTYIDVPKSIFGFIQSRMSSSTADSFEAMSFLGPWRVDPFKLHRRQQVFATLLHWYEAAKFDERVHPETLAAVLLQPNTKTARKFSARHNAQWKADWALIRGKVLLQGLQLCKARNPSSPFWDLSAGQLTEALHEHGIDDRGAKYVVDQFLGLGAGPRVLVLGAAVAPAKDVSRKINAYHRKVGGAWTYVHWMGKHVNWLVHDWADSNRLSILPVGASQLRLTADNIASMIPQFDHAMIFERRGGSSWTGWYANARMPTSPLKCASGATMPMRKSPNPL